MGRLKTMPSGRPARVLLLCWRALYPLLLYMLTTYLALYGGVYACAIRYGLLSGERDEALARAYGTISTHLLLVTTLAALLALPLLLLFLRRDRRRERRCAPPGPSVPQAALLLTTGAGAAYALNFLMDRLGLLETASFQEIGEILYGESVLIQVLGSGLIIPLVEELIFRGLSFSRLRQKMSFWPAALVSALIFGLFHGNLAQGTYAFLFGLLLSWAYERTGRLGACVLMHIGANLLSVLVSYFMEDFSPVLALACGAAAVFGLVWIGQRQVKIIML